tara:strand:+ start:2786 stop:3715 length:930 start_codon:yes stop_codon:yes gene_type:complete
MILLKPKFWDSEKITLFSIFLFPITICIKILFFLKKIFTKKNDFSIPIICIGNIYLGGTGKTPLSIELYYILKKLKKKPAFIRKEYTAFQDEINLLKKIGPVYENKKRSKAINEAIKNKFDVAILDDGFQDFSIKKNLSIVCFNERQWIGNGLTIPSGPLRENIKSLNRANYVFINGTKKIEIEKKILRINNNIKIFYTDYVLQNIKEFERKKAICFAGIGNPNNFFDLLKKNNVNVIEEICFSDHHNYSKKQLESLVKRSKLSNSILLTTEKDYERISSDFKFEIKYIKAKIKINDQDRFIDEIKKFI